LGIEHFLGTAISGTSHRDRLDVWMTLSILFEFGVGHYAVGDSWSEFLEAYNILEGRV
jgi:hypothetical protein